MGTESEAMAEQNSMEAQNLDLKCLPNLDSPPSSVPSDGADDDDTVARLSAILTTNAVNDFSFKRVPSDYYDWPLEARRDVLDAASIDHLCKSIVLVRFWNRIRSLLQFQMCVFGFMILSAYVDCIWPFSYRIFLIWF